jgi:hypothetical protein
MTGRFPAFLAVLIACVLASFLSGCGNSKQVAESRLKLVQVGELRKESGRLNRDYFAAPGFEFIGLKQSLWPKTFTLLKPLRVTLYRDGAAVALGGDAGRDEWGLFVVPPGLNNAPPDTRTIRYAKLDEGVFYYSNSP